MLALNCGTQGSRAGRSVCRRLVRDGGPLLDLRIAPGCTQPDGGRAISEAGVSPAWPNPVGRFRCTRAGVARGRPAAQVRRACASGFSP